MSFLLYWISYPEVSSPLMFYVFSMHTDTDTAVYPSLFFHHVMLLNRRSLPEGSASRTVS
jgi:hypothetical protein